MSKQSGNFPDEPEVPTHKQTKKKKGKYELWVRINPKYEEYQTLNLDWFKFRSYNTLELAKLNMENNSRKWNPPKEKDRWEFEIREKND
jgi:hypothetical protein